MPLDRHTFNGSGNNSLLTPSALSNDSLYRLKNELIFPRLARHYHEQVFASEIIGDTISIKKPFRARIYEGKTLQDSHYNVLNDEVVEVVVNKRHHGAIKFDDKERALAIKDFGQHYLQPIVEELAHEYDESGAIELANSLFQFTGTPGTNMTTDDAQDVRAYFTEMSIPQRDTNFAVLNPSDFKALAEDIKPLNLPSEVGRSAIYSRYRGVLSNFKVFESVHVPYLDVPSQASSTPLTAGANQDGSSITTDGWAASTKVLNKGNIITIADVNELMVRGSKRRTGRAKPFTVTADVTSNNAGGATIPIYPAINDGTTEVNGIASTAYKNVNAKAGDNKLITVVGGDTAGARTYKQSLFWDMDALEYVQVLLSPPRAAKETATSVDPESGASITFTEWIDFKEMESLIRCDIFWGVKCVYPEIGLRNIGARI